MRKINYFKFVGGPKDGLVVENGIGFTPDVIDGDSLHLFGEDAYSIATIHHDDGIAIFEHMGLINEIISGETEQTDSV